MNGGGGRPTYLATDAAPALRPVVAGCALAPGQASTRNMCRRAPRGSLHRCLAPRHRRRRSRCPKIPQLDAPPPYNYQAAPPQLRSAIALTKCLDDAAAAGPGPARDRGTYARSLRELGGTHRRRRWGAATTTGNLTDDRIEEPTCANCSKKLRGSPPPDPRGSARASARTPLRKRFYKESQRRRCRGWLSPSPSTASRSARPPAARW